MSNGYLRRTISAASSKPLLPQIAKRRLAILAASEEPTTPQPEAPASEAPAKSTEERFYEFFAKVNPRLYSPRHFAVYIREVLRAVGGDLRLVFAAPPQHGKTEVTVALMAFLVLEHQGRRWAYITYNQKRANAIARKFKRVMAEAGAVCVGPLAQMYLPGGGQMLFTSVDGGITGEPVDGAAFIDDPYKNQKEADSKARRELVESTYRGAIETRVHPGGSIFLLATRWHPEDLSGTLIGEGWLDVNLAALAEGEANDNGVVIDDPNGRKIGEALFPEKWPVEELAKKRAKVLDRTWWALYQGRPRPPGGKVFQGHTFYTELPRNYRGCYGIDLAYTAKTSADWSICLELWREERPKEDPLFYVVNVVRDQAAATDFALTLRACHVRRPTFRMHWRASGTEKGSAGFLREKKLPIKVSTPPGDKLVSATQVAIAWNEGRVLVPDPERFPEAERWLFTFLDVIRNFTGQGNEVDDDVDALGNAHAWLSRQQDDLTVGGARSNRR